MLTPYLVHFGSQRRSRGYGTAFVSRFSAILPQDELVPPCIFLCIGPVFRRIPVPSRRRFSYFFDGPGAFLPGFDRQSGECTVFTFSVFRLRGLCIPARAFPADRLLQGTQPLLCFPGCSGSIWAWRLAGASAADVQRSLRASPSLAVLAPAFGARSPRKREFAFCDLAAFCRKCGLFHCFAICGFLINSERVRFADSCWT